MLSRFERITIWFRYGSSAAIVGPNVKSVPVPFGNHPAGTIPLGW